MNNCMYPLADTSVKVSGGGGVGWGGGGGVGWGGGGGRKKVGDVERE